MKTSRVLHIIFFQLITLVYVFIMTTTYSQAQDEAKLYVVTDWGNQNCGSNNDDRPYWDNMVDPWYDEITNQRYRRDGIQIDGNFINSQFADSTIVNWGDDTDHLDEGDAVLGAWHGRDDNNVYTGLMRIDEQGNGDCQLRRDEMEIGDNDLEFLHLSSCHSMDENMWNGWRDAFNRAHQVDGFHGLMWIGRFGNHYKDFADDAFSMPIANAWVHNLYIANIAYYQPENRYVDQCPVAYAVGRDVAEAADRLFSERYNNVLPDLDRPVQGYAYAVTYIDGCDPADEPALPSPEPICSKRTCKDLPCCGGYHCCGNRCYPDSMECP